MKKARIQSFGKVLWEVTDLEVSYPSSATSSSSTTSSTFQWRSVCFEKGKPENLVALMECFRDHYNMMAKHCSASLEPLRVMSYPEFVALFN